MQAGSQDVYEDTDTMNYEDEVLSTSSSNIRHTLAILSRSRHYQSMKSSIAASTTSAEGNTPGADENIVGEVLGSGKGNGILIVWA